MEFTRNQDCVLYKDSVHCAVLYKLMQHKQCINCIDGLKRWVHGYEGLSTPEAAREAREVLRQYKDTITKSRKYAFRIK